MNVFQKPDTPAQRDPYLDLPLQGVRLIEASAGTGKTFTLATLVTRLVVERGLRIGQVLAVTFTEAATQELRQRIRERLERAARIALVPAQDDDGAGDALSRDIIERHVAGGEARAAVARRLRQAALEIDLAAIFTIHGFCARVLRDCALETGQAFDAPTVLASDTALREELAADLWRSVAADPGHAEVLRQLWARPAELAQDLRVLLSRDPILPPPKPVDVAGQDDPRPALRVAARALCDAFATHGDTARADIEAAIAGKVLHNGSYKPDWVDRCWRSLQAWVLDGDADLPLDDHIDRLTPEVLLRKTSVKCQGRTPQSPLCLAVAELLRVRARRDAWMRERAVDLLHALRARARERLAELKRTRRLQTYDDMIDGVADALDGAQGAALVDALRRQYRFALVDEFQDTDTRQWAIFRRVFGHAHEGDAAALFLIGDPKQAIYGFRGGDVHAYLQADGVADRAPALDRNFRSRPGVLRAIAALYAAASQRDEPFADARIRFQPVRAGGRRADADFLRDGVPAPALRLRVIERDPDRRSDDPGAGGPFDAEHSRALATRACVADIHALLRDARAGRASIEGRPVAPGDIAVLVRTHHEATRIRDALAAAGIPAVAAGRQSLFATDEAHELLALFEALLQPADDGRLRAALSTVLVGLDARDIAALEADGIAHAGHQHAAQRWRERWQQAGPLALVSDLAATAAERLLGLFDGERRLTNVLQLGELLQQAQARVPGLHGQLDWLRGAIAEADVDDESQLLRLESDARRVQIVTVHKSKGLEYPLVYLPFAGVGGKPHALGRHCVVHDDDARAVRWKLDKEAADWQAACDAYRDEQRAEDARLLYVALTRARHALWLVSGNFYGANATRLAPMLADHALLAGQGDVVIDASPLPPRPAPLAPQSDAATTPARTRARTLSRDWWVYSFSQLMRSEAGERASNSALATASETGAGDEPALVATVDGDTADIERRFGGSRFGNVLHDALEHVDFNAWQDWRGGADAPPGEDDALRAALQRGGYAGNDLRDGIDVLRALVGHTLTVVLPEGGRLCELPSGQRRAEMEFHFSLAPTSVDALLALLHRFQVVSGRSAFGARRRLEGLMTGKIDLTYTRDGRWHVLDYKSNRLPGYDHANLDAAMAHSGYELQALIYTLALHRWLRFRLGERYDYARDFGGVRYLFCRGLAAGGGAGVHAHTPHADLVHALDALFAGAAHDA